MKGADRGWAVIIAFALAHNVVAAGRREEMLSEACDRYMTTHPWITRLAVAFVATHLINAIPPRCDPCHYFFSSIEQLMAITVKMRK